MILCWAKQCKFLTLFLSVLLQLGVVTAANSPQISPTFAFLGQATEFKVTDVKYPYTICTTTFPDNVRQAVYAQVTPKSVDGDRNGTCVVDAPSAADDQHSVTAKVKLQGAPGPWAELENSEEYSVKFARPPTVDHSYVVYDQVKSNGSIAVILNDISGLRQVTSSAEEAIELQLDLSVIGGKPILLKGKLELFKSTAVVTVDLAEPLPNGRYPSVLLVHGNPIALTASGPMGEPLEGDEAVPQTRTRDQFNVSDTAHAAPLLQPAQDHTFVTTIDVPSVGLSPHSVPARSLQRCAYDGNCDDSPDEQVESSPALSLQLGRIPEHSSYISVLLAVFPADEMYSETELIPAADDLQEGAEGDVLYLVRPPKDSNPSFLWVVWGVDSPRYRRLLFEDSDEPYADAGYTVRIVATTAAAAEANGYSSWVATDADQIYNEMPTFSVDGQQVLHRGDMLTFDVMREGPFGSRGSLVKWEIVYLDPQETSDKEVAADPSLTARDDYSISVNAASTAGLLVWGVGDKNTSKAVNVTIEWDAVPYDARWMLAVRLMVLQNGVVADDIFLEQTASPPPWSDSQPSAAPLAVLDDQINGFVEVLPGTTDKISKTTHFIVYGVPEGACAPSTERADGVPTSPPLPPNISLPQIHSLSLRVSANESEDAAHFFAQTMPRYRSDQRNYSTVVPFDLPYAALVVSSSANSSMFVSGCGSIQQIAATSTVYSETGNVTHSIWPLQRPDSSQCTVNLHVCTPGRSRCPTGSVRATHEVLVQWLADPELAQIDAISVTVGHVSMPVCSSADPKPEYTCDDDVSVRPGANLTSDSCFVDACVPHSSLSTSLKYHRGETIKIIVQPAQSEAVAAVSIGQRVFLDPVTQDFDNIAVTFTLFDRSEQLSPFVPFFIRQRSHDRTSIDVPVTLTLSDGITAVPFTLLLDIDVLPLLPAPSPSLPPQPLSPAPEQGSSVADDVHVEFEAVTESAAIDLFGAEAFKSPGQFGAPAPAAAPAHSRRLREVSVSAPEDQAWLQDPLDMQQCSVCTEGFYSDNADVVCQRCQPGACAPHEGMMSCAVCPPGSYASVHGASSCTPCVHGTYTQLPGSSACRLCPLGYTTESDGASVCNVVVQRTVAVGKEYALAVSFSVRLSGASFDDVSRRTGVLGSSQDILKFLVSLDTADAFRVSTADVQVSSMTQLKPRMLRVNLTANIGMDVPDNASKEELDHAILLAELSKDSGIRNLIWTHTTEALGAQAITEDDVQTVVLEPDPDRKTPWQAIIWPIVAAAIILGSVMLLKCQRAREPGGLAAITQSPSLLLTQLAVALRAAMCLHMHRGRNGSEVSSQVGVDTEDDLELDMRATDPSKGFGMGDGIELMRQRGTVTDPRANSDARKRAVAE